MEELRSTEALDREILEDARKKADRALRAADQAAAEAEAAWKRKLVEDIEVLERRHAERVAAKVAEIKARLPLEKRRLRAERAERLLRASMEAALRALPRGTALAFLERELSLRAGELDPDRATVRRSGLSEPEAAAVLSRAAPGASWRLPAESAGTEVPEPEAAATLPALTAEDGKTLVRVSLAEAGELLLLDKRAELAAALLGQEALDD